MSILPGKKSEPWQEALKLMSKCPVCGNIYSSGSVRLFLRKENSSLVHSTCNGCKSHFMAIIMMLGNGVSSVGMVTDLNFEDAEKLYGSQPISVDEVIEGHQFMQKNILDEFRN